MEDDQQADRARQTMTNIVQSNPEWRVAQLEARVAALEHAVRLLLAPYTLEQWEESEAKRQQWSP